MTEQANSDRRSRGTGSANEVFLHQSERYSARSAAGSAGFFVPYLRPGMSLLDCGCGTGSITLDLADIVAPGEVVGIDIHEGRVNEAREAAERRGVKNVRFEQGSVMSLPFDDSTFDAAFEHTVFQHVKDVVAASKEVLRVLKPGGFFGAADQDYEHIVRYGVSDLLEQAWGLFDAERRSRGMDSNMGQKLPDVLGSAGFRDVQRSISFRQNQQGGSDGLVRMGQQIGDFMRSEDMLGFALAEGLADKQTLQRMAEEWKAWGSNPAAFFAGVNGEAIGWKPA